MNTESVHHDKFREIMCSGNWSRLIFMLIFGVLLHVAGMVMWVLSGLQFLFSLLTGKDNENLRNLGGSIAVFVHQALDFVCYNTEQKPFPFSAWPDSPYETRDVDDVANDESVIDVESDSESGPADDGNDADTETNPDENR